ncbi:MAG TPA: protein kinase [Trebonia sp.]
MEPLSANDPRMIGDFRLHAQLGAGGMGQVYLGFSPAGRAVAIKVIHPQFARDQEFLRRFSHEVAAASAVGGLYTAPVVDYDLKDGTPWLATAYVPGPTLAAVVSRHGPLPEAAVWRLAAGLTEALRAIHAKGLIHRDLKPANVLLADDGPHVIDFGISRATEGMTQLTSAGMTIGTPGYMSPEQAQTLAVGPSSDIFSLGCVLAYAATGAPPFGGENPAAILFRIVSAEPDLNAVPLGLRQVIEACLRKNPADRPDPARLITMIGELGPATPVTLGSFWPDSLARVLAAEQAAQTPAGLTPPAPFTGTTPSKGTSGSVSFASSASPAAQRTPTALATSGQGPAANGTGHAPMISDGYYAAAQRPSAPTPVPSGFAVPPSAEPPKAYGWSPSAPQPGNPTLLPGQAPSGQAASGQPSFGSGPSSGGRGPTYPGQSTADGQPYPGQPRPGGFGPMSQYTPGRRRPMRAEVPPAVRRAIGLMYAGFAVTLIDAISSSLVYGRYDDEVGRYTLAGRTAAANNVNSMSGAVAVGMLADYLGLVCWLWLAVAARRGNGWTRIAGAALLGIYSACTLFILLGTHRDPGVQFTTVVVWAIGVAALIPLWSQQAREFFFAWRKR